MDTHTIPKNIISFVSAHDGKFERMNIPLQTEEKTKNEKIKFWRKTKKKKLPTDRRLCDDIDVVIMQWQSWK